MNRTSELTLTLNGTFNGTFDGTVDGCLPSAGQNVTLRLEGGLLPGTPMPLPGSCLPPNFRWADRALVLFADWPDLKAVHDAGLLDVLPADATEEDKARFPRKWVLNDRADGLFLPDIGGRFARDWRPEQTDDAQRAAGSKQDDAIRNITGQAYICSGVGKNYGGVLYSATKCFSVESVAGAHNNQQVPTQQGGRFSYLNFNASGVVPTADENRPLNDARPVAIYMGRNAQDTEPEPAAPPSNTLTLLARYTTAGEYIWTAPDLYSGKPYPVFVRMKGAGAGGSSAGRNNGYNYSGNGGGEGCLVQFDLTVTPGAVYSLTVGEGGAGGLLTPDSGYSGPISRMLGTAGEDTVFSDVSIAPGAPGQKGGNKTYPESKAEVITPGASGGAYTDAPNQIWQAAGAHGGGNGGGITSGDMGILGGGGAGGTAKGAHELPQVIFQPGGKGGDGFIEIYTR